ncbi:MAG: secretin N-terminal domain-containing protein [Candidatus Omnitrophica bacterium]|nr:secretin N-terminal domain-containing protein [Candidatus Omnitrophota bacterium]
MFLTARVKFYTVLVLCFILGAFLCQAEDLKLKIFKVRSGSLQSLYQVANDLKSAQGTVSIDENTGSLIVLDSPEVLARIEAVVAQLDIPEKMVEIKVLVVDAGSDFFDTIGISSGQVHIPRGEFEAIVRALSTSRDAHTRVNMMVKTLSNHSAQLAVSKDEIFGQTVTRFSNGAEIISPLRQAVGEFLEVLPVVNTDGTITVVVRPSSSSLTPKGVPEEKTVLTQAVLRNGDTIAIGGIDSTQETSSQRRGLFGVSMSKTKASANRKVVMFLTAVTTQ